MIITSGGNQKYILYSKFIQLHIAYHDIYGNKPSLEQVLTQICWAIWCHLATVD